MKRRILLVEDNENNRYLAKFLLERDGFEVIVAVNGLECLEAVRKEKPELIVMDIQMPACASIPIVGVSSFAMPADREKAMNAGFAGYIEKPINPLTFAQQIAGFLKQDPKS